MHTANVVARWGAVAVTSLVLGHGLAAQAPSPQPAAAVRFALPNGLRVWVQEDHTRPVALVQVAYKVGAINEDPGTTGTAHYVEHMVYRATEHTRNEDVYGYNDRIGGRWTGGTSRDGTSYGETVPSWALEDALRVTAERMGRALFDSTEFERERNNVVTEANGFARLDAMSAFHDAVMLTSFELHPYRYSSNTWAQDNLAISRADAYDYYTRYYGPNNAVLTVVGDVTPDDVRRLVERHFGSLRPAPRSGAVRIVEPPQRAEKRVVLHYAGDRQQLEIVYRAPQASVRDYPVLVVLDRLLAPRLRRVLSELGGGDVTTSQTATPYPFVYRIALSADRTADAERLVTAVQHEIERLRAEEIASSELDAARADVAQQGRGGRGRGGGGGVGNQSAASGVPPRQSNLTQIANELTSREVFPWEVGPPLRDQIQRAQQSVTPADLAAYADRWLRPSQRTIGLLAPGTDDFMPRWSNDRALAGARLEVPPQTTLPAKRARPTPVPARALQPLSALSLRFDRRTLDNGVVVRAAPTDGSRVAIDVRIAFGGRASALDEMPIRFLAARAIANDSALRALAARIPMATLLNDGYFDIRIDAAIGDVASTLDAVARALRRHVFEERDLATARTQAAQGTNGGRGRGGAGGGAGVAAEARGRILGAIAPEWLTSEPAADAMARVTPAGVSDFVTRHLHGGAVTIAVAGPATPDLLEIARRSFGTLPRGDRVTGGPSTASVPTQSVRAPTPTAVQERVPAAAETQVTVVAGLPGVSRDNRDWRALELLNYIAGVPSYGGRLGWALTKAGFTYSVSTTTTFGGSTGHILFTTKCDTRNLDATVQAIREVIAGIAEHGVDDWEVREAQAFTLGRTLLYGTREDSGEDAIAGALLDSEYFGNELLDLPAWSRGYLGVTREQVNAAARRYYQPDLLRIVSIGAVPTGSHASPFAPGTFRALFEP